MRKIILFIFLFFISVTPAYASPNIVIQSIPSSIVAGQEFEISFSASNLDINASYKVKSLGGDSFTQVDTWNSSWLQQNASWSSMPEFTSNPEGSASATIKARFDLDTPGGIKDFKIRIRKFDVDPNYDSSILNISVSAVTPSPSPSPTASPTQSSNPTPTPSPTRSPTPTPVPTKKPTLNPTAQPTLDKTTAPTLRSEILGTETENPVSVTEQKKLPVIPIVLIGSGIVFMGLAVLQFIRVRKNNPPS